MGSEQRSRDSAHEIKRAEVEERPTDGAIPIYQHDIEGEDRFVCYGETDAGRLIAVVVTERGNLLRVVTAYDLDAGQRRDYIGRRREGE